MKVTHRVKYSKRFRTGVNEIKIKIDILALRPNNWYLNQNKVEEIERLWELHQQNDLPLPLVTQIDGEFSLIDGHSRVYVAYGHGERQIDVEYIPLSEIEGSAALYIHIHRHGPQHGIRTIADLANRIVSADEHRTCWVAYCENWLEKHDPDH